MYVIHLFKIILAGDGAVGKTELRRNFMGERFKESYFMTIGADFAVKQEDIGNEVIKFQIWDLAGQLRFETVRSMYFAGTNGIMLVYDVTNPKSYQNILERWVREIIDLKNSAPAIILGNKIDLRTETSTNDLTMEQGVELAEKFSEIRKQENNCQIDSKYYETSAKTGENVSLAFKSLGKLILETKKT